MAFIGVAAILFLVIFGVYAGDMLGEVADGRLPAGLLGSQLLLRMPEALLLILPLALFIGVMMGLGRLYRDQEMSVMRACGFYWRRMLKPMLLLALPLALLLGAVGFLINPWAVRAADEQLDQAFRSALIWGLKAGQFHSLQQGNLVIYVESMNEAGNAFEEVFIYQHSEGKDQIWTAASGRFWFDADAGSRFLSLDNGRVTEGAKGRQDYSVARFSRADLKLPDRQRQKGDEQIEQLTARDLWQQGDSAAAAELHWRLSPMIAVVLLGLLAIPLAHTDPREGRYGRLVMGLLTYAVYANLLTLGRVWLDSEKLPAVTGLWWVHGLLLVTVLVWIWRQGRMLKV